MQSIIEEISALIGRENTLLDCSDYPVEGVTPKAVAAPSTLEEASKVLEAANRGAIAVTPRGSGTKLYIGNVPDRVDLVVNTSKLNRVIEYEPEDLTCTSQAGIKLSELQKLLGKEGQFFSMDPPFASTCSLGGTIASNASGPRRLKYGSARDLIIGTKLVLPTGEIAKAGGKVVKNVAGYDLRKLYIGSLGTLGLIGELTFKVYPMPDCEATFVAKFGGCSDAGSLTSRVMDSYLQPTALEILDGNAAGIILEGAEIDFSPDEYAVLANFSGVRSAVLRQIEEVDSLARETGARKAVAIEDKSQGEIWRRATDMLANFMSRPTGTVSLKTAIVISKVKDMLARVKDECAREGIENFNVSHAGSGIVYTYLILDESADGAAGKIRHIIDNLRMSASDFDGSLVVEYAPPAVKRTINCWGPTRSDFVIMRGIKQAFDPKGIMNPGRFLGGL